jgi:hypothetical protein
MWLQSGIPVVSIAEPHHVMRLQPAACHAAPVWHSGSQHCGTGSQHFGAASYHAAPVLGRIEAKIFVFVFSRKFRQKFVLAFHKKSLRKFFVFQIQAESKRKTKKQTFHKFCKAKF